MAVEVKQSGVFVHLTKRLELYPDDVRCMTLLESEARDLFDKLGDALGIARMPATDAPDAREDQEHQGFRRALRASRIATPKPEVEP